MFDLDAGPVTITLPDAGKRFMSLQVISEDQYAPMVVYGAGDAHLHQGQGRHALRACRPSAPWSIPPTRRTCKQVHALQDAIKVEQRAPGKFEVPNWDQASQKKVRDALLVLGTTLPALQAAPSAQGRGRSGAAPDRHRDGLGRQSRKDATYLNVTPAKNDGTTVYRLNVKDVPVDGFWSISLYNAEGYFEKNPYDAYSLNNITAKKSADGSVAIQFGGCDGKIPNCLPIMTGWNYTVRLYRPRAEILNGKWKFPEAAAGAPTVGQRTSAAGHRVHERLRHLRLDRARDPGRDHRRGVLHLGCCPDTSPGSAGIRRRRP